MISFLLGLILGNFIGITIMSLIFADKIDRGKYGWSNKTIIR